MSYMNQAAFAPTGGIQELSFEEIEEVGGAINRAELAVVEQVTWVVNPAAGLVVSLFRLGYEAAHGRAEH